MIKQEIQAGDWGAFVEKKGPGKTGALEIYIGNEISLENRLQVLAGHGLFLLGYLLRINFNEFLVRSDFK